MPSIPDPGAGGYVTSAGEFILLGFPDTTPTGDNLYITYGTSNTGTTTKSYSIDVSWDSGATWTNVVSTAAVVAKTTVTTAVPSGTDLASVQVRFQASTDAGSVSGSSHPAQFARLFVYDVHIQ